MAQCRLDVERGAGVKYVQFAADTTVLPPLLFDLATDPGQLHDLASATSWASTGWAASERLARWRMRNEERTLSGTMLTSSHGMVVAHDEWR
jgi:hypothetical protein